MTTIINYNAGNLGSIQNMLNKLDIQSVVSSRPEDILSAKHLILPGVGAFDFGMQMLTELKLIPAIRKKVMDDKTPILGVCLGAQLFCNSSEEGKELGLGFINAVVRKFPTSMKEKKFSVPHMGWDYVKPVKSSKLLPTSEEEKRFYFVHSFGITCLDQSDVLATNEYSMTYHSAYERENILGVQFHPEKSHRFGKQLYKNFIENF